MEPELQQLTNACSNHPQKPAVGICVRCGVACCRSCLTQVQGINHCHACYEQQATGRVSHELVEVSASFQWLSVVGWFVVLTLLVWLSLWVASYP